MNETKSSVDQMQNRRQNIFWEGFECLRGVMIATTNLWNLHLPATIPRSMDVDIEYLAKHFRLTGGQITIILQNAASEAATRTGTSRQMLQMDLLKYCNLEEATQKQPHRI